MISGELFYTIFIILVACIKLSVILTALSAKYYEYTGDTNTATVLVSYKDMLDFVFMIMMSVLLIYLFGPFLIPTSCGEKAVFEIDPQTKILLSMYGVAMITTADWYQLTSVFV